MNTTKIQTPRPDILAGPVGVLGADYYSEETMKAYAARCEAAARMAERERCAKVCEATGPAMCEIYGDGAECIATADACADAIRAG